MSRTTIFYVGVATLSLLIFLASSVPMWEELSATARAGQGATSPADLTAENGPSKDVIWPTIQIVRAAGS